MVIPIDSFSCDVRMAISLPITAIATVILTVLVYSLIFCCIISKKVYSPSPTVTSLEMKENLAYGTSGNICTKSVVYDIFTT